MLKIWTGGATAVVLAAASYAHAQDAVQWRVEDGGNGHWYQVGPDPDSLSWDDSRAFAIMQGGDLIALSSQDEWDYLRTVVLKAFPIASFPRELGAYLSIGLLQSEGSVEPAGGWAWIDGSGFEVPWRYNEPNNSPGASCNEQWGQIHRDVANGFFVNDYCDVALPQWIGIEWSADCNGDGIVDYGQILDGTYADDDGNGVPDCCDDGVACECTGDLNSDGVVGPPDIGVLLSGWGTDGSVVPGSDINEDGIVNGFDLAYILGWWGPCR